MDSIPIVAFRYYGRYGHFRKPYSNVSSLSYPFPPRTAIAGLLGAILGIKKDEVAGSFDESKAKIAVAIDAEIKTVTHVTNLRQDSSGQVNYSIKIPKRDWVPKPLKGIPDWNKPINPYPMELLREPSYLLYVNLSDCMGELVSRIKTERYVYTPCMGLSEFLARLEHVSEGMAEPLEAKEREVSTVICKEDCSLLVDHLEPKDGHNIQELKVPYLGTPDRTFTYRRYLVNMALKPIPVQMKAPSYQFEDKIITFL
jgi:CRISPR-associated protein Cas5, Hmari subtype